MRLLDTKRFLTRIANYTIKCKTSKVKTLLVYIVETGGILSTHGDDVYFCMCLTGNIRVYCRVRPFLPGQPTGLCTAEVIDEQTLLILTPAKNGKGKKLFTFNKVFGPSASQGD